MKKIFLLLIGGFALLFGVGYFLYRVGLAIYDIFADWRLAKELEEVREEAEARRAAKRSDESS